MEGAAHMLVDRSTSSSSVNNDWQHWVVMREDQSVADADVRGIGKDIGIDFPGANQNRFAVLHGEGGDVQSGAAIRGLRGVEKRREVQLLVGEKLSLLVCLQETKLHVLDSSLVASLWGNSSFNFSFRPSEGASGGLLIMWDDKEVEVWSSVSRQHFFTDPCRFLSFGGRLVLLKSVLTSLPVYALSFFKASSGQLDHYLFSEGVRRVLVARYGEEVGGRSGSSWWREIANIRDGLGGVGGGWFRECVSSSVGDGGDTLFWHDPWLGGVPFCVRFRRLFDLAVDKSCTCNVKDTWRWHLDPIAGYTFSNAYFLLTTPDIPQVEGAYALVWHKYVPLKVSIFAWRLVRSGLGVSVPDPIIVSDHFLQFSHSAGGVRARSSFLQLVWLLTVWIIWNDRNQWLFNNTSSSIDQMMDKVK
ncbi:hypothetical protein MTR_7g103360 [Medicago truncatula]|uniref:Reverse transcriptase zinc-binding domain-containing protein n=1 Tax=Medicago truncatula TaxID=3880 RepID=A0A072UE42_MEDTR|nr:hypothetical protein MTR_7g103360 [Medicago truncatula]